MYSISVVYLDPLPPSMQSPICKSSACHQQNHFERNPNQASLSTVKDLVGEHGNNSVKLKSIQFLVLQESTHSHGAYHQFS